MKIIPAIDLINGKTVRLKQGKYDQKLSYDIDPVDAAKKWEDAGCELIHVVDLDGAKQAHPVNLDVVESMICAVKVPIELGGGFKEKQDIQDALEKGVSRVVIGSKAFEDITFAKDCIKSFKDKVILSADARNFKLRVRGWEKTLETDLFEVLKEFVSFGVKEIIYTDIQKDGTLAGPSIDNLERLLEEVPVKVISAGGIKTIDDVYKLKKLCNKGLSGAIIGRALYEGTINLEEAINAGKEDNTVS